MAATPLDTSDLSIYATAEGHVTFLWPTYDAAKAKFEADHTEESRRAMVAMQVEMLRIVQREAGGLYTCVACERVSMKKLRQCSRCHGPHYCDATCQRKHWEDGHRKECGVVHP